MSSGLKYILTYAYVGLMMAAIGVRLFSTHTFPDNEPYPAFLYPSFAVAKNPDGEFRMPIQSILLLHTNGDTTVVDQGLLFPPKPFNSSLKPVIDRMIANVKQAQANGDPALQEFQHWLANRLAAEHDLADVAEVALVSQYIPYWENGQVVGELTLFDQVMVTMP